MPTLYQLMPARSKTVKAGAYEVNVKSNNNKKEDFPRFVD